MKQNNEEDDFRGKTERELSNDLFFACTYHPWHLLRSRTVTPWMDVGTRRPHVTQGPWQPSAVGTRGTAQGSGSEVLLGKALVILEGWSPHPCCQQEDRWQAFPAREGIIPPHGSAYGFNTTLLAGANVLLLFPRNSICPKGRTIGILATPF